MKSIIAVVLFVLLSCAAASAQDKAPANPGANVVKESPLTVKLSKRDQKKYDKLAAKYPELSPVQRLRILRKIIWIGMSTEQVYDAWGLPIRTNSTINSGSVLQQLVYGSYDPVYYVYVENGVVVSFSRYGS
jgi:hypothetical protein